MQMRTQTLDVVCLVGLLALTLGGGVLGIKSARTSAEAVDRRNKSVDLCLVDLKKAQSVLDRLNGAIKANQSALEQLRKRLPESQAMGEFLSGLDAIVTRSKVGLSKVTPGAPITETLCTRTPLGFSCRGAFADLHAVLYNLETQERIVRIERVTIGRGAPSGDCSMDVSCGVYGR